MINQLNLNFIFYSYNFVIFTLLFNRKVKNKISLKINFNKNIKNVLLLQNMSINIKYT